MTSICHVIEPISEGGITSKFQELMDIGTAGAAHCERVEWLPGTIHGWTRILYLWKGSIAVELWLDDGEKIWIDFKSRSAIAVRERIWWDVSCCTSNAGQWLNGYPDRGIEKSLLEKQFQREGKDDHDSPKRCQSPAFH